MTASLVVVDNHYPPARRFAPIVVGLSWVDLVSFAGLLLVTSAASIWFQVAVLCSCVSSSRMLLLHNSEMDLRIRLSEYFF